jgi:acetyl-CoA carboxylase biotin carboxylase subunit
MLARPELRAEIGEAALRIARAVHYSNAGTLEFLADQDGRFYFLEMNTRLQVEHPVTEWVTGVDLVRWQLKIAAGEPLSIQQRDVQWNGSAIECRVYAEDPANNFFPSPGRIAQYVEPSGPGVRVDGGVYSGWDVPLEYDPLLAKLSTWAGTREASIERMIRAVSEYRVLGITTNLSLFREIMRDEKWRAGQLDTGFLDRFMPARPPENPDLDARLAAVLACASIRPKQQAAEVPAAGVWLSQARKGLLR